MASFQIDDIQGEHPLVPWRHHYDECADYGAIAYYDAIEIRGRVCSGMEHLYEPLNY
jgi:hypothetical protein